MIPGNIARIAGATTWYPLVACSVALLLRGPAPKPPQDRSTFSRLVEQLSEGAGFFPSDNLVSNETSYLPVLDGVRTRRIKGGAYLGVGPEQGFSYIAEVEPEIAFMIDIRRDNLLLHLLLKAIFEVAGNRLDYLCLLYGRPAPPDLHRWTDASLATLLDYIDRTPLDSVGHARRHGELMERVIGFDVPLTSEDLTTIKRFHDEFATLGLELRYAAGTRARQAAPGTMDPRQFGPWFPPVRDIYRATDRGGHEASYLATEDRWRTVRTLERKDRVIPVVGDLAGPKAVKAIAQYLGATGRRVSAFYLSNVESYLFRGGSFAAFAENVRQLPVDSSSVLIRSWFGRGSSLTGSLPGHRSVQQLHSVSRFLAYAAQPAESLSYWGLVTDAAIENP
jgi:hypothetical protein